MVTHSFFVKNADGKEVEMETQLDTLTAIAIFRERCEQVRDAGLHCDFIDKFHRKVVSPQAFKPQVFGEFRLHPVPSPAQFNWKE